jgi:tetratricopeptide (TPR) repeat protein
MRDLSAILVAATFATTIGTVSVAAQPPSSAVDNHIAYYERLLQRQPRDARTYLRLGDAFVQKARETGDLTYFNRAEAALKRSLELSPRSAGALRHLAYVFYSRHEFPEAITLAERALEIEPTDADAHGVLGDAYLEVGRYADAERAYEKMMTYAQDLYSYGRRAGLKSLRGDPRGAIVDLTRAVEAAREARRPAEGIAWAQWQLATEHFMLGELDTAAARHEDALRTYPRYYRALGGLAQVRAAQQRHDEAIELYTRALAVIPLPEYAAALGDLYQRLGRETEARTQYELVEYIGHLNTVNRVIYNRELAYFYADHDVKLDTALELARRELDVRKDVYAYDVLAWALYKQNHLREARAAITEALKVGTRDARLFFHAGMIERALGHRDAARDHLQRALATNPHFHPLQAPMAAKALEDLVSRQGATTSDTSIEERRADR